MKIESTVTAVTVSIRLEIGSIIYIKSNDSYAGIAKGTYKLIGFRHCDNIIGFPKEEYEESGYLKNTDMVAVLEPTITSHDTLEIPLDMLEDIL